MGNFTLRITTIVLFSGLLFACKKNSETNHSPQLPDLQTRIAASATGFVFDESDQPLQGALVKMGASTTLTDETGYFEFQQVQVVKSAALITVTHNGYFDGFRTYEAVEGKTAFVRIRLSSKTILGTINGSAGGNVSSLTGLSITLPAMAVMNEATGGAYTGMVTVAANLYDPSSEDFSLTRPGDMRGLNEAGEINFLQSYAMAGIELMGSAGEKLQIANGSIATISIPVPQNLQATAPAIIALSHFNETSGLWEQNGSANRSGNNYVAQVSHFSFWNCNRPAQGVYFSITVTDSIDQPIPFAWVRLAETGNPFNSSGSYTDASGYAGGLVPANTNFTLTVNNTYGCTQPVYSSNIVTANTSVSMGSIRLPQNSYATISGTVADCAMSGITNGYLIMRYGNLILRYPIDSGGTFNFNTLICGTNSPASFIAGDEVNFQASSPLTYHVQPGNNSLGTLQACGVSTMEYFYYTINGASYTYTPPASSFSKSIHAQMNALRITASPSGVPAQPVELFFDVAWINNGTTQALRILRLPNLNDSLNLIPGNAIGVNIIRYEQPFGMITGNFSGTFIGNPPSNRQYNVTGSFKVR